MRRLRGHAAAACPQHGRAHSARRPSGPRARAGTTRRTSWRWRACARAASSCWSRSRPPPSTRPAPSSAWPPSTAAGAGACGALRARQAPPTPARTGPPLIFTALSSSAWHIICYVESQGTRAGCSVLLVLLPVVARARAPAAPQRARARAQAAAAGQPGGRHRRAGRPGRGLPRGRGRQPAGHRGRHLRRRRRRRQLRRLPARGARRAGAPRRAPPWPQPLAFHTAPACSRDPRGLRLAARCLR